MDDRPVVPNGFLLGLLWGTVLALPFWMVLCVLVILALPPHQPSIPSLGPDGIHLNAISPENEKPNCAETATNPPGTECK